MPELSEPLKQAKGLVGQIKALGLNLEDKDTKESVFGILKDEYQPLYLALTNFGFGAAQSRFETQITTEREAKERAQRELQDLKTAVAQKQDPEIRKLNEDWQRKFDEEMNKLRTELEAAKGARVESWHERDEALLEAELTKLDVPPTLSKTLARDRTLRDRRDYDEKGSLTVYQAGQRIPFSPGSEQTHLSLLANEIAEKPDIKQLRLSRGDAGGGVTAGGSQGPMQGDKAFYDKIKADAKKEQETSKSRTSLKERIKNR